MENGGIGLSNVRESLRLIYGANATFTVSSPPQGASTWNSPCPLNDPYRHETDPHHHRG